MSESLIGKTLAGKYLVKGLLGSGGMGSVYEGEHIEIGKRVAIKVIDPSHAGSEEVAARFKREARAASRVESDHIVQVFDVGSDPTAGLYMVMEILTGEDLMHRLQREQRLPVPVAIRLALQAAKALAKAHAAGVVHRDLKPANLFLTTREDGSAHVKILDFGISKLTRDEGPATGQSTESTRPAGAPLTRSGVVIGTPQYMSPEQAQGLAVDLRTDVWSLGAVLYEMISGKSAYSDLGTYEQTIIQIVLQRPKPLAEIAPWVPRDLAVLIHEALTHDLAARLGDCAIFAERLAAAAASPRSGDAEPALATAATISASAIAVTDPASGGAHTTAGMSVSGQSPTSHGIPKRWLRPLVFGGLAMVLVALILIVMRFAAPTKSITVAATATTASIEQPSSTTTPVAATIAPLTAQPASSAAPTTSTAASIAATKSQPPKKSSAPKPAGKESAAPPQPDAPNQFGAAGVSTAF